MTTNEPPVEPTPPDGTPPVPPAAGGQTPPPPPPAPGGYGAPPPAPAGYGAPPSGGRYSIGDAFNYGWTKFQANIGPIILATIAVVVGVAIIELIGILISGGLSSGAKTTYNADTGSFETSGGGFLGAALFVSLLFGVIAWLLALTIGVGIVRAALDVTYGRPVEVKTMFKTDNLGQVVLAALIIAVATGIGALFCGVGAIIVGFFTQYTMFFLVDKNMPALEAIKASVSFVNKNLGTLIGFYIAAIIAVAIGFLLCFVGSLLAIPVVVIAAAYTYRTLQGETAAA